MGKLPLILPLTFKEPEILTDEVVTVNTFKLPDDITANILVDPLSITLNNSPLLPVISSKVDPLACKVTVLVAL